MWDHGQHIAFREEIIKGRDLIPLPPSWWPSISCPRRHGWWVQAVDSITLTRCKGCLGMVQITFLNPNTKTCHSCCSTADTFTAGSPQPPPHLPPDSLPLVLGKAGRSGQRLGKTRFHTAPFVHLTRLFRANWTMKGGRHGPPVEKGFLRK